MHHFSRGWREYPWPVIIPVALYLILTVAGVSQSSIGVGVLRENPGDPAGTTIGRPQDIRSDEYLTSSPINIGVTATGSSEDLNPLSGPQQLLTGQPSGPLSSIVQLDGTALQLGPVLPDQMLFAARWWLPFLLIALAAPGYFRRLTGSPHIGYFAGTLMVLSPANAWWSFSPGQTLAWSMAGAVAMLRATEAAHGQSKVGATGWTVLAALLLARTIYTYQPWAIVIVPTVVLAAAGAAIFAPEQRRRSLTVVGAAGVLTLASVAILLWENRQELAVVTDTVYPGSRRASGGPNAVQELFAATNLEVLTDPIVIAGTNASEISSSFAVAFVWIALLLAHGVGFRHNGQRAAVIVAVALSGFWLAWSTVSFGSLGEHIPLVNIVTPGRATDVVGFLGVILLCLLLPRTARRNTFGFALLTAGSVGATAAYAGSLLQEQNIIDLATRDVWFSSALLSVVVLLITRRPRQRTGYVLGGILAFLLVWNVNPLQIGLGDLRNSDVAKTMLEEGARTVAEGTYWATDAYPVDSLLIATGVPALTGRQISGPDTSAWLMLDPGGDHEDVWNRGGAFIWLGWTEDEELTWSNPSPDVISITGSPCTVAERMPGLARVVSSRELELDCLTEATDTFVWAGEPRWIYDVRR